MRTRIALVAIAPIAVITTTVLMQAATVQQARGAAAPSTGATPAMTIHPLARPAANAHHGAATTAPAGSSLLVDVNAALLARAAAAAAAGPTPATAPPATPEPSPPAPAQTPATSAPAGPADTVTPAERAAWERVAMCEEGGDWQADSPRFSGGLGISRTNWDLYGGQEFASEGAVASEDQQIMVAERIQPDPPDQYGCHGW